RWPRDWSSDVCSSDLQASEDGLEFALLLGGCVVEGRGLGAEFHVDGFAGNLIGPLEVGAVTLGGVAVASTLGPAAFHHSLQNRRSEERRVGKDCVSRW